MKFREAVAKDLNKYLEVYENVRSYLESGGDITYAFLNLAKLDLDIASKYIVDPYCKKQVLKELNALDKALSFASMAHEWKIGVGGWRHKTKLVAKAIIEILRLSIIHISRI